MCDQTEVVYSPGDVVWVKLGPVWWPGEVHDYDKLPEEITTNLRKKPIAVVKFFQEDSFEYVKNLNAIYHYNCRRKHDFIKKGLDMVRSNSRDVPSNMKMFPNDVITAEHLTDGNTNILDDEEFAPKEKEDYSELFGKKTPKKVKADSSKKDPITWRLKSFSESPVKTNRRSLPSSTVPRLITHRRFITKALEGRSDHEIRIRQQASDNLDGPSKLYNCHLCGFSSSRINVIVLHNKSHSAGYADAYLHPQLSGKTGRKSKVDKKNPLVGEKRRVSDLIKSDEPPVKKKYKSSNSVALAKIDSDVENKKSEISLVNIQLSKKPVFGRKKSAKDKAEKMAREKQQNDAFRENLLKDWDDEDMDVDDGSDSSKVNDSNKDLESSMDSSALNAKDNKELSKSKETSCFDFDDSDDGLNIGETVMKFGQKIPRVLGEKSRKQTKSLNDRSSKHSIPKASSGNISKKMDEKIIKQKAAFDDDDTPENKQSTSHSPHGCDDKGVEDFDNAFKSLLHETAVPLIPDVPNPNDVKKLNQSLESDENETNDGEGSGGRFKDGGGNDDDDDDDDDDDGGGGGGGSVIVKEFKRSGDLSDSGSSKVCEQQHTIEATTHMSTDVKTDRPSEVIEPESLVKSDAKEIKEETHSDSQHFLVKTSEEVATSSSDDFQLENTSPPNENSVAASNSGNHSNDNTECFLDKKLSVLNNMIVEEFTEKTSSSCIATSVFEDIPKVISTPLVKSENFECQKEVVKSEESLSLPAASCESGEEVVQTPLADKLGESNLADMDFDINSMPVIIGDDMVENQNNVPPMAVTSISESGSLTSTTLSTANSGASSSMEDKVITLKTIPRSVTVESTVSSGVPVIVKDDLSSHLASMTKDDKLSPRRVIISPTGTVPTTRPTQVATIKVQPSTTVNKLTVPGGIVTQKGIGSTSQVLILKSAVSPGKSQLQKIGNTPQLIQQGGKVLILTNPQAATTQNKILSHKNISPNKLTGTRILTTKGTVLTTGSPAQINKPSMLQGSSKITTKSGQKILINKGGIISQAPKSVIISKSGLLTTVSPTVISGKTPLITQNILTSKSESGSTQVNLSQFSAAGCSKGTNLLTASGLTTSKSVVLAPVTVGKSNLTNNQKLKMITSKANPVASAGSGTKLMIQSSPSRMILPSSSLQKNQQIKLVGNLKGQANTGTFFIQTSQGLITTTPLASGQMVNKGKQAPKASLSTVLSSKSGSIQVPQAVLQSQNKLVLQKIKPGPNILQKTQKKPTQRHSKKSIPSGSVTLPQNLQSSHSPSPVGQSSLSAQDTLILSSPSGIPVISQSNIVQSSQLDSSNQTALVYLTVDETGSFRSLESAPVVNYEGTASTTDSQTLFIDPGTTDLENIFLAIDDAGNVVNIAQPVENNFTAENTSPPTQDILAKALANTQVLQQETVTTENSPLTSSVNSSVLSGCVFVEQPPQYPQPSLSHSVLETSLTLNQPIMTPLEVPSAVSPCGLEQMSSLSSGFLSESTLITSNKERKSGVDPSMPLLTEETDCSTSSNIDANKNETMFYTQVGIDGSHTVLTPVSSGSQLAFQLNLDESNAIVSSTPEMTNINVVSNATSLQNTITSNSQSDTLILSGRSEQKTLINSNNITGTLSMPAVYSSGLIDSTANFRTNKLPDEGSSLLSNSDTDKTDVSKSLEFDVTTGSELLTPSAVIYNRNGSEFKVVTTNHSGGESEIADSHSSLAHDNYEGECNAIKDEVVSQALPDVVGTKSTSEYSNIVIDQSGNHQTVSVINKTVDAELLSSQSENSVSEGNCFPKMTDSCDNGEVEVGRTISLERHSESSDAVVPISSSENDFASKGVELEER